MSGGVDSAAAAALVARSGRAALAVTIKMWPCAELAGVAAGSGACCSPRDAADAARAAKKLGLDHVLVDLGEEFRRLVLEPFCREYAAGRTPSPCLSCNRFVKFGALFERVKKAGCTAIATGHYARVKEENGEFHLLRGKSRRRDQSYFLAALTQTQLGRAAFPVGEMTRSEVRELVAGLGLAVGEKPSSQEFCLAPEGDYERVLARCAPEALEPGPLLDTAGRRLGEHRGIGRYTVGQRRGLGLAAGEPLYVQKIVAAERAVVVGPDAGLWAGGLLAGETNWIGAAPAAPVRAAVRVRSSGGETPSTVTPLEGDRAEVRFDRPVRALAPGQWACFYDGERVLGGGVIERAVETDNV